MCFIALSRSLASSVFPWFPVHVCWQKLLVLVSCPVMCNGDVVGLGPFYSPQRSRSMGSCAPRSACFFQQRWSTLWDISEKALHHWLTLFWGFPGLMVFNLAFNSVILLTFFNCQIVLDGEPSTRLCDRWWESDTFACLCSRALIPMENYMLILKVGISIKKAVWLGICASGINKKLYFTNRPDKCKGSLMVEVLAMVCFGLSLT